MTPQERQRVAELFDRLAQLESTPRERDAEAAIAEGLRQAPHAPYALVQTVLIQEEALERANARIRELEDSDGSIAPRQGGFLDAMREAFSGQPRAPRASVPVTRRPADCAMGAPPGFQQNAAHGAQPQQQIGRGGSFLGQAASIAAGVVVGSMVVDALRGQFGGDKASAAETGAREQQASNESDTAHGDADQYETADAGDGGWRFRSAAISAAAAILVRVRSISRHHRAAAPGERNASRLGSASSGDPRLKAWMAGTSPAMTK